MGQNASKAESSEITKREMIDKDILEASINIVLRAFEDSLVYAQATKDALERFGASGGKDVNLLKWAIKAAARGEVTIKNTLDMLQTGQVTVQQIQSVQRKERQ